MKDDESLDITHHFFIQMSSTSELLNKASSMNGITSVTDLFKYFEYFDYFIQWSMPCKANTNLLFHYRKYFMLVFMLHILHICNFTIILLLDWKVLVIQ